MVRFRPVQQALVGIWFGFFLFDVTMLLVPLAREYIEWDSCLRGIKVVSAAYAPHLSVILGFYLLNPLRPGNRIPAVTAQLALGCSFAWNALLASQFLLVAVGRLEIEPSVERVEDLMAVFPWLVGGVIGAFFGKAQESQQK